MLEKKRKLAESLFDKENITIIYLQNEGNTIFFVADTDIVTPSDIVNTIRKEGVDVIEDSIRASCYATRSWLKYGYWVDLA